MIGIAPSGPRVRIPSIVLFVDKYALIVSLVSDGSEASTGMVFTAILFLFKIFLNPFSL